MDNKRSIGTAYEEKAVEYLTAKGYRIIKRNFRCRIGEIDIIAKQNDIVVFVEVKYRKTASFGYPEEAVSFSKQKIIRKVAEFFLVGEQLSLDTECRFDVIAILGEEINHIENAF
ncbi:MAG: YraN family protein [Lachnospiraceae bacterium]|nr:YraN family protein [Lachnospiraceae bacterium]